MCGIVGLLLKGESEHAALGALVVPMLSAMEERGPDSAGLAVFHDGASRRERRISLLAPDRACVWRALAATIDRQIGSLSMECHQKGTELISLSISSLTRRACAEHIDIP